MHAYEELHLRTTRNFETLTGSGDHCIVVEM
jgi:hypothetical protein